ncbi:MAG: FAD synthetase family protein [Treponema sp.]
MKIFSWNEIEKILDSDYSHPYFKNGSGISIGSFDGIHKGHRLLLTTLTEKCRALHLLSGVVSFSRPLPSLKHSDDYQGDLTTLDQRLKIFESLGIDFAIIVDFTQEFAGIRGIEFLQMLVDSCNMKYIAEGVDFRCGYKGSTDVSSIKYFAESNGVKYDFVEPVYYHNAAGEDERISSSYIRSMVLKRFLSTAQELLERPYSVQLEFESGAENKKGAVSFLKSGINQALPPCGIYYCTVFQKEVRVEITEQELIVQPADCSNLCDIAELKNEKALVIEFQ